jgi:hypothetical protein
MRGEEDFSLSSPVLNLANRHTIPAHPGRGIASILSLTVFALGAKRTVYSNSRIAMLG